MKAFWWFKENSIAGMARPGFNSVRWFDLPFVEAVLLGWIGQYSEGSAPLSGLAHHLNTYVPKIYKFHKMDDVSGPKAIQILMTPQGIMDVFQSLNARLHIFKSFTIENGTVHFEISDPILSQEIDFLKGKGIHRLVTLTERHHQKDILNQHFSTHHISIVDLGAPSIDQARQLAQIITKATQDKENIAVHCLAGIGRTSTMLIAAHMFLGASLKDMEILITKQNPSFALTGPQGEFLRGIHAAN